MRIFGKFLLVVVFSCIAAEAAEEWGHMLLWVDKYPSDKIASNSFSLLAQPPLKSSLRKILPKAEIAALNRYDVEAPVHKVGEYLIINKCLPHNCPSDMAMLIIDVKNEKLWVGFFSREEESVSTRWYGTNDDYSVLPDEIKKEFLSRHGD